MGGVPVRVKALLKKNLFLLLIFRTASNPPQGELAYPPLFSPYEVCLRPPMGIARGK